MKQVHQEDINDLFDEFEVPASTDGSYMGTQNQVRATQEYMDKKIEEKLTEINARLKARQTKVSIKKVGNTLQLRATLPLKPGDTNKLGRHTIKYGLNIEVEIEIGGEYHQKPKDAQQYFHHYSHFSVTFSSRRCIRLSCT